MGMHDVEQHEHAHLVRAVDKVFQVVRLAVPTARGKEIRYLIAERGVVRVLHDCHQLYGVVAEVADARQVKFGKLTVGADALALLRHADVRLVDEQRRDLALAIAAVGPVERARRRPDLPDELIRLLVLHRAVDVAGDAVECLTAFADLQLDALPMLQDVRTRQLDFPDASFAARERMRGAVPAVEVAHEVYGVRAGRPLAEHPAGLGAVKAVEQIAVGECRQIRLVAEQALPRFGMAAHAQFNIIVKWLQIGIDRHDFVLLLPGALLHS